MKQVCEEAAAECSQKRAKQGGAALFRAGPVEFGNKTSNFAPPQHPFHTQLASCVNSYHVGTHESAAPEVQWFNIIYSVSLFSPQ